MDASRHMHALVRLVYPPQCKLCDARVEEDHALCTACWRETPFIAGLVCDACGTPLPGDAAGGTAHCDDCLGMARPWTRGRAVLRYAGQGRTLVLGLKHADRTDLVPLLSGWLARAARPLLTGDSVLVPVPVHRWRLLRRRYNQAALLAAALGRRTGTPVVPDALVRVRATGTQDGKDRAARFGNVAGAIRPHPTAGAALAGRAVLLVDDVFTSGATLAAATEAAHAAGAREVSVVTLARVANDA